MLPSLHSATPYSSLQHNISLKNHNDRKFNAPSVTLRDFFPDLFQSWQQDSRQGDAAEFTSLLLNMADSCCVKQSWEQRLIVPTAAGIDVTVHDHGGSKMLINLCPTHDFSGPIELAELFQIWREALGMSTALLDTPTMLCVQFERLNAASTRRTNPIHFADFCQVPIFCGPNIDIDWIEFTPVAMVAHTGSAHSGHYQTAFMIGAGREPFWLLLDDHRIATPFKLTETETHQGLPMSFLSGVTLIWLCKSDCLCLWEPLDHQLTWHAATDRLALWNETATAAGPAASALDDVLNLLQNS